MATAQDHLTEYAFRATNYCRFIVPGTPAGKGRPRFNTNTGRAFTPKGTKLAESIVIEAWTEADCPRLPDGPVALEIEAVFDRPRGHFKRNGDLSATGRRWPAPTKKPDWDNIAKLVGDALNKRAYRDDAQIVDVRMVKRWSTDGESEHMVLTLEALSPDPAQSSTSGGDQ